MGKRRRKKQNADAVTKAPNARAARQERKRLEIEQRRLQAEIELAKVRTRNFWRKIGAGVVGIPTLLGMASAILSFQAHVSVAATDTLDLRHPFATRFSVTNTWNLPIYDVRVACGISYVIVDTPSSNPTPDWRSSTSDSATPLIYKPNAFINELKPGEGPVNESYCPFRRQQSLAYADITFFIRFRPKFWPFSREERFRFVTEKASDGRLVWGEKPLYPGK